MTEDLEPVSRLQSLDQRIAHLQHEIAALPKHIAAIEKTLDGHHRRLEADRAALAANLKDRKRYEEDIKLSEQKISKLRDQTQQAKTNEQFRAFQHEIEFCEKEIRSFEDRILELMTASERFDQNAKKTETAFNQQKKHVDAEKAEAREKTASHQKELNSLRAERQQIVSTMKPSVLASYERIRKKWHGATVLAEAVDSHCSACQIALRPQFLQDLRKGDKLMFCESCGRFLYYNAPVTFEHDLAAHSEPRV
ncbi:MAG TPA: C4-type zinc ribbon domain-containing protein [Bryobacteraceae bacterium]|jgi:predicted  nucleic acid-binding Zn-ribbon protein|nr:C4-type zinc ribbon domain-containing protein [Bryobacteraceae bacterium]